MARRQCRPSQPHARPKHHESEYRNNDQHEISQNIYRMWRDFPSLRLGQFFVNALAGTQTGELETFHTALFYKEDSALEQKCFEYWVRHSGRATKKQKEQYDVS